MDTGLSVHISLKLDEISQQNQRRKCKSFICMPVIGVDIIYCYISVYKVYCGSHFFHHKWNCLNCSTNLHLAVIKLIK